MRCNYKNASHAYDMSCEGSEPLLGLSNNSVLNSMVVI